MAARADIIPFSSALVRRLLAPTVAGSLVSSLVVAVKRHLSEPRLPRMSDEWLQHLDRTSHRQSE
jgi:hypothetical protein